MVDIGKVMSPGASWTNKKNRKFSIKKSLRRNYDKPRDRDAGTENDQDTDRPDDAHFDGYA